MSYRRGRNESGKARLNLRGKGEVDSYGALLLTGDEPFCGIASCKDTPDSMCQDSLHHIILPGINRSPVFEAGAGTARLGKAELGLSGAEIARHLRVNMSSTNPAIPRVERNEGE
jgi:hypothetical protein